MTKDSLIQIIKDCEEGKVSADAVLTAVEIYSSASNNGKPIVSGSLLLHDLFHVAAIENEDGMPVIKWIDKPNGGSIAYVRYDAMVNKLNALLKQ
jgi:hypothetical protein